MKPQLHSGSIIVLMLFLLLSLPSGAHAHGMMIEREADALSVYYDNGTPVSRAVVSLFDKNNTVLWEGKADEAGKVNLPVNTFVKAVAEDGLGHRAEYLQGQIRQDEIPRPLAAALGVSFFIFIASVGNYLNKKKQHGKSGSE
ncbi:MAG: hypothetical protein SCK29_03220 [Bacillota bacterium]|nr:hypothetical protein [Bacillota bacterium]MDW7683115.1 hypothetical protein [Bacillota bacterium]